MRPIRYSINMTLDGCCDHQAITPDEELHPYAAAKIARADAIILGRVTYQMMESAFRLQPTSGSADPADPFARTMDAAKKYVVSSTLDSVDWNSELLRGDLKTAVEHLKAQPGGELAVGGMMLPLALAELNLIDEYEFIVHPRLAGHGPTLLAGLSKYVDLRGTGRHEFSSGAVAMQFEPTG